MTKTNSNQVTRKLAKRIVAERDEARAKVAALNAKLKAACGGSEPSGSHDWADELAGLLRVTRSQRDGAERELAEARAERDEARADLADVKRAMEEIHPGPMPDWPESRPWAKAVRWLCGEGWTRAEAAEAELARRATGDETTSEGYYRREWESACERVNASEERARRADQYANRVVVRAEAAEAERDRLRVAIMGFDACGDERPPFCAGCDLDGMTGEEAHDSDCAAARAALAGSAPAPTPTHRWTVAEGGSRRMRVPPGERWCLECGFSESTAPPACPRSDYAPAAPSPPPISKAEVEAALANGAPHARASMATLNGREDKLCGRCGFLLQDCRCRPPEGAEPETAPPPSGDPTYSHVAQAAKPRTEPVAVPTASECGDGHSAGITSASTEPGDRGGGQSTVHTTATDPRKASQPVEAPGSIPGVGAIPPASAGDKPVGEAARTADDAAGRSREESASSGSRSELADAPAASPSEPEPGAPRCANCSKEYGDHNMEALCLPLSLRSHWAAAAVPEEPRAHVHRFSRSLDQPYPRRCLGCGSLEAAAAPKVEAACAEESSAASGSSGTVSSPPSSPPSGSTEAAPKVADPGGMCVCVCHRPNPPGSFWASGVCVAGCDRSVYCDATEAAFAAERERLAALEEVRARAAVVLDECWAGRLLAAVGACEALSDALDAATRLKETT